MDTQKEAEHELEWNRAQSITISVNLVTAAKEQLLFLAVVDRNRWLYEGPALEKAIYRYNACWLPLLAQHTESPFFEGPLIVPIDCEWIWHCHRLNPIRYKSDCEKLYGKILDCSNVVSSTKVSHEKDTKITWNSLYPEEPYQFDMGGDANTKNLSSTTKSSTYDFVSASKRQSSFFYHVSKPHVKSDVFLEEAVARYKGFLHLKRRNNERSIDQFCVPTYDIDLIWHAHQLHPVFYSKDVQEAVGSMMGHDDSATDRSKGKKLDVGYTATLKQWEETFGSRYRKAGCMNRGPSPSPLSSVPVLPNVSEREIPDGLLQTLNLPRLKMVEVFAEVVAVKNLPANEKSFMVTVRKKRADKFFSRKLKLHLLPESGEEKWVTYFRCEPNGELYFQLNRRRGAKTPARRLYKTIGAASISLDDFFNPLTKLAVEQWVELLPCHGKPICLRIAMSFTVPIDAPYKMRLDRPKWLMMKSYGFLGRLQLWRNWTNVTNQLGEKIISFQMRDGNSKRVVARRRPSGQTCTVAEWTGSHWSMMDGQWGFHMRREQDEGSYIAELLGCRMLRLFEGPKLKFEEDYKSENGLVTVVEFSPHDPYGKAIALIDLISGYTKVDEEWFTLTGILLAFILQKCGALGNDFDCAID